jgi:hypothetical protein
MSFSMTPDVPQNLNALLLFEFNWHILQINVRSKPTQPAVLLLILASLRAGADRILCRHLFIISRVTLQQQPRCDAACKRRDAGERAAFDEAAAKDNCHGAWLARARGAYLAGNGVARM